MERLRYRQAEIGDDMHTLVSPELLAEIIAALDAQPVGLATDGLPALITTILRKYGGTMKGRGDHDIFDALVRYRAALASEPQS